jgi:translation initiation factor 2 beta subunit (eIF-2beta)/eIF-5
MKILAGLFLLMSTSVFANCQLYVHTESSKESERAVIFDTLLKALPAKSYQMTGILEKASAVLKVKFSPELINEKFQFVVSTELISNDGRVLKGKEISSKLTIALQASVAKFTDCQE